MIELTGKNFIATQPSAIGDHVNYAVDPKTQKKNGVGFVDATDSEIAAAFDNASESFETVSKNDLPLFLKEIAQQILSLGDQLIDVADGEIGLGAQRLINERKRTVDQLHAFAEYIQEGSFVEAIIDKDQNAIQGSKPDIRRMLFPIGPVAVFPASNFPFAFGVCGGDAASAWAAGCPVVVKAHPSHPQTSELFAHAVNNAIDICHLPKGMFSLLHGEQISVSKQLVLHPKLEAIGFTGSLSAGRAIYDLAATREKPIPVFAEMGSINPIFVVEKNDDTAQQLADSVTLGMGQFCTKPGVIFIKETDGDLIEDVIKILREKQSSVLLNKSIQQGLVKRVDKTRDVDGVNMLLGGCSLEKNNSFENTVLVTTSVVFLESIRLQYEHFGPVVLFVKCASEDDFIEIADHLIGQLTATVHIDRKNIERVSRLFSVLRKKAGRLILNGVPTGVEVCTAMHHGGPYPATTSPHFTSVGMTAIKRFLRPVSFQNMPDELLPVELRDSNEKNILRLVNKQYTREAI